MRRRRRRAAPALAAAVVAVSVAAVAAVTLLTGGGVPAASGVAPASVSVEAASTSTSSPGGQSSGDSVRAAEYWLDAYGIRNAWATSKGAGVRIAIIDTGVGKGPIEFEGAVVGGTDVSGTGTPDGRTPVGAVDANHGSWVASLAAGRGTGADTGMIGVAPQAELLSISVGFGTSATVPFTEQIAGAMHWAVDHGADVINLSLTTNTSDWDPSWDEAFLYAYEHDVVVIAAAGNRGSGTTKVGAPATIPGVLTVGGVDRQGKASLEASTQGITIGVMAPSENLLGVSPDGRLVQWSGTSGAAPIVAGIAALVRSAHPEMDADDVINHIIRTAKPVVGVEILPDPLYGYGIVDAAAAVSANLPSVSANPMGSLRDWVRLYRRAVVEPAPEPTVGPVSVPALPPAGSATRPSSPLMPSTDTLLYGSLPLLGLTVTAILVALGVTAAVRRVRSARAPREPSR